MRILFVGGMYRGYRLAQRLLERGENIVGAFVYEEDAHEAPKYAEHIASLFASRNVWCKATRKITENHAADVVGRLAPDVIFCLGWRTLIPPGMLAATPRGGIAVHDSLLPRLRGFAPTNWGMILGHERLGATLFQLTDEVDAGVIYFQEKIEPAPRESFASIQERIAEVSVRLFERFLDGARAGTLSPRVQCEELASYACSRRPQDGEINWHESSESIDRLVRALGRPGPGAFTYYQGRELSILDAHALPNPKKFEGRVIGRVFDRDPATGTADVLCGEGVLRIARVQRGAEPEQPAAVVLTSVRESLGMNHSHEIVSLRTRVEELEQLIRRLGASDETQAGAAEGADRIPLPRRASA
ncbi:MAG TPA: formyltransferase family protein [Pirellulales bacterium]|nr:formyltransferase family protein [Pirellulales bacterium]